MTTSIDKIREMVQGVREEHVSRIGHEELCDVCEVPGKCPTLRLAEKMLKLSEWVAAQPHFMNHKQEPQECIGCAAERVLAEVSEL